MKFNSIALMCLISSVSHLNLLAYDDIDLQNKSHIACSGYANLSFYYYGLVEANKNNRRIVIENAIKSLEMNQMFYDCVNNLNKTKIINKANPKNTEGVFDH